MSILRTISMDIHEQKNEIKEIKSSFDSKLDAVSYTHLDVYKRQEKT